MISDSSVYDIEINAINNYLKTYVRYFSPSVPLHHAHGKRCSRSQVIQQLSSYTDCEVEHKDANTETHEDSGGFDWRCDFWCSLRMGYFSDPPEKSTKKRNVAFEENGRSTVVAKDPVWLRLQGISVQLY
ncbi:unnamed protein product [Parnassius apollo]|uniref:(apollo) hypothetical protein n=1 Tax=Parnassius apollo TaxID=110799 RepID=A0A8S3X7D4_PARAO|nr:unnamed protein product [Parnassius apollo]